MEWTESARRSARTGLTQEIKALSRTVVSSGERLVTLGGRHQRCGQEIIKRASSAEQPAAYSCCVLENSPLVGVLALQGDVREHQFALAGCRMHSMLVRRRAELSEVDALILPGGESTAMSRLLEVFDLLEPLRARVAEGMPVYGSCAGMILLCREVLDGRPDQRQLAAVDAVVRRNAFGRQVASFEADLDFVGITGGPVRAVFIRAPWVEQVGSGVEVLARVPEVPTAGNAAGRIVAIRQGSMLATAFHPELTGDRRVHQLFCEMVRKSSGVEVSARACR